MRSRNLSLVITFHTVSSGSRYGNIEVIVYLDMLCAITVVLFSTCVRSRDYIGKNM